MASFGADLPRRRHQFQQLAIWRLNRKMRDMAVPSSANAEAIRRILRERMAAAIARYSQNWNEEDRADHERARQAFANFQLREKQSRGWRRKLSID